jgi:hypothetical protein
LFSTGWLSQNEYSLCQQTYALIRQLLPPPDVVIRIVAPLSVLAKRRESRGRPADEMLVKTKELGALELFLNEWVRDFGAAPILCVDSLDGARFSPGIKDLVSAIEELVAD